MSPRYYLICAVTVLIFTVIISLVRQTSTRKEFFMIMMSVAGGLAIFMGLLFGLGQILEWLGIAKSGFIF